MSYCFFFRTLFVSLLFHLRNTPFSAWLQMMRRGEVTRRKCLTQLWQRAVSKPVRWLGVSRLLWHHDWPVPYPSSHGSGKWCPGRWVQYCLQEVHFPLPWLLGKRVSSQDTIDYLNESCFSIIFWKAWISLKLSLRMGFQDVKKICVFPCFVKRLHGDVNYIDYFIQKASEMTLQEH